MTTPNRDAITELLATAGGHSSEKLDLLVPLVYDELRRMAHAQLAREGNNATLDTTGLVHEAYFKLVDGTSVTRRGRTYFFGAAAQAMRQVLVDAARRRNRHKRGGGERPLTLEEDQIGIDGFAAEILDLDSALSRLELEHPRPAKVVECRFFGGLDVDQTAELLEIAPRTVDRDWALARAWLNRELGAGEQSQPAP
ncbi:MAG: sigma-70 family RNA polymerase sigma factor [Thermoanaerobaculia bacterium]|nr:sigma-70 family RNA polymerase sigma factor [Thermoanaerobaculia bacterium]